MNVAPGGGLSGDAAAFATGDSPVGTVSAEGDVSDEILGVCVSGGAVEVVGVAADGVLGVCVPVGSDSDKGFSIMREGVVIFCGGASVVGDGATSLVGAVITEGDVTDGVLGLCVTVGSGSDKGFSFIRKLVVVISGCVAGVVVGDGAVVVAGTVGAAGATSAVSPLPAKAAGTE